MTALNDTAAANRQDSERRKDGAAEMEAGWEACVSLEGGGILSLNKLSANLAPSCVLSAEEAVTLPCGESWRAKCLRKSGDSAKRKAWKEEDGRMCTARKMCLS